MYTNLNCGKECFESEYKNDYEEEKKKLLSEVGFEPTPTYVDQKSQTHSM